MKTLICNLAAVFVWSASLFASDCETRYLYGGLPRTTRTLANDRITVLTNCGYVVGYHPLISELVKGGWARYVRRVNRVAVGTASDFHEFLFGTERARLGAMVPILLEAQNECCFYCERSLRPDPTPSDADVKVTRDLIRAGQLLKLEILDHVIVGRPDFKSLRELGYFYS